MEVSLGLEESVAEGVRLSLGVIVIEEEGEFVSLTLPELEGEGELDIEVLKELLGDTEVLGVLVLVSEGVGYGEVVGQIPSMDLHIAPLPP